LPAPTTAASSWHNRRQYRFWRGTLGQDGSTQKAVDLLMSAEAKMQPPARQAWRWRILLLRALIDRELGTTEGLLATEACERHFMELTDIFYAQQSEYKCAPPTRQSILAMRASESTV
jgi:hypothetical protein